MMLLKRVDANQTEIVSALRRCGCTVQILSAVGHGCPDILVSYRGLLFFCEIKDGAKRPSARKLTPDENEWHERWRDSPVFIVVSVEQIPELFQAVEDFYVQAVC